MKVAILTDTHFGAKAGEDWFLDHQEYFFKKFFFPEIKKRGVDHIIHMGDVFDNIKLIRTNVLCRATDMCFDVLRSENITMDVLAGNHDVFHKENNYISPLVSIENHPYINVIYDAGIHTIGGIDVCYVPWIHPVNKSHTLRTIKQATKNGVKYCFGHLELKGFKFNQYKPSDKSLLDDNEVVVFDKFDAVHSGHYHHPSSFKNIHYLGANFHIDASDKDCTRGFYIFDLTTGDKEFIEFEYKLFRTFTYTEDLNLNTIEILNSNVLPSCVTVKYEGDLDNTVKFERFLNELESKGHYRINNNDFLSKKSEQFEVERGDVETVDKTSSILDILQSYTDSVGDLEKEQYTKALFEQASERVNTKNDTEVN